MFDVGFSELLVIGVVALVVLGPERLPRLARDVGRWVGRARHYVNRLRDEIDREVELGELRRLRDEIEARARSVEDHVDGVEQSLHATLDEVAQPRAGSADPNAGSTVPAPRRRTRRSGAADAPAAEPGKRAARARKAADPA